MWFACPWLCIWHRELRNFFNNNTHSYHTSGLHVSLVFLLLSLSLTRSLAFPTLPFIPSRRPFIFAIFFLLFSHLRSLSHSYLSIPLRVVLFFINALRLQKTFQRSDKMFAMYIIIQAIVEAIVCWIQIFFSFFSLVYFSSVTQRHCHLFGVCVYVFFLLLSLVNFHVTMDNTL